MRSFFTILASASKVRNPYEPPYEPTIETTVITNAETITGVWDSSTGAAVNSGNSTYRKTNYIPVSARVISFEGFLAKFPIIVYDANKNYIFTWFPLALYETIKLPKEAAYIAFMTENHNGSQTSTDYNITITQYLDAPAPRGYIYDPTTRKDILTEVNKFTSQQTVSVTNYSGTDRERIQKAIDDIHNSGSYGTVRVEGQSVFYLDAALLIKSNVDLLVDGCKLKLNNYVFDNVIRCAGIIPDTDNPYHICQSLQPTIDFKIRGINGASIEGQDIPYSGVNPKTGVAEQWVADPYGWRTILVLLSGGERYELSGFSVSKPTCYSISQEYSRYGHIHHLDITSGAYHNGDGIDLRMGCKHFIVEDITGTLSDDGVALNANTSDNSTFDDPATKYVFTLQTMGRVPLNNDGVDAWIEDVTIKNCSVDSETHTVILLTTKDRVRYIDITNVDDGAGSNTAYAVVEAYTGYNAISPYGAGFINNINIDGVISNGSQYGVKYSVAVKDSNIANVQQNASGTATSINSGSVNVIVT